MPFPQRLVSRNNPGKYLKVMLFCWLCALQLNIGHADVPDLTASTARKAISALSLQASAASILLNQEIEASGRLTPFPDEGVDLKNLPIELTLSAPDGSISTLSTQTETSAGDYGFSALSGNAIGGFDQVGQYSLSVSFAGNTDLDAASSPTLTVQVAEKAGYALIVQGRVSTQTGLQSHNKTTNRIYSSLRKRGFAAADILYFNYDVTQTDALGNSIVDALPSKSAVRDAIENQLPAMSSARAAPLYIFLVDHGSPDVFHIGPDSISSVELGNWIDLMESRLSADMLSGNRVLVYGACYSGSFIPRLSAPGRIIISSAAADEESYMGPIEQDGIRSGEYFIGEFMNQLQRGNSIRGAFTVATGLTETFTRTADNTSSSNRYFDNASQHPLLDDDGNGVGSNLLDDNSSDGALARDQYLGVGNDFLLTPPPGQAQIDSVTETRVLPADESTLTLFAEPVKGSDVGAAWFEVRRPNQVLSAQGGSIQLQIDLERVEMQFNPDPAIERLEGTYTNFTDAGLYEIFYYVSDIDDGEVSSTRRSRVFKESTNNQPPSTVTLLSPADASTQTTVMTFDWSDASDPEGDALSYTLEIASEVSFSALGIELRIEEINASTVSVDQGAQLPEGVPLYWRIITTDSRGASSTTLPYSLNTDNTNGVPGVIQGLVYANTDFARLAAANVTTTNAGASVAITEINGEYILLSDAGDNVTLSVSSTSGEFSTREIGGIEVLAGATTIVNVGVDVTNANGGTDPPNATNTNPPTNGSAPATSGGGGGTLSMLMLMLLGMLAIFPSIQRRGHRQHPTGEPFAASGH